MGLSVISHNINGDYSGGSATSFTVTMSGTTVAGASIAIFFQSEDSAGLSPTISDTEGNSGWTSKATAFDPSGGQGMGVINCDNIKGGTLNNVVTITMRISTAFYAAQVVQIGGTLGLDQSGCVADSTGASSLSTSSMTTLGADLCLASLIVDEGGATALTPQSPWSTLQDALSTFDQNTAQYFQSTAGSTTCTWAITGSNQTGCAGWLTYLPAPSGLYAAVIEDGWLP